MQASRLLLALIIFGHLAGCNQPQMDRADTTAASQPQASADSRPVCPSQQFDEFLVAFMGSSEVQKQFTAVPLQYESIDATVEPEPQTITHMLDSSELTFPVMSTEQERSNDALTVSTKKSGANMVVTMAKPDTDYQISYHFRQVEGCWQLYRKQDESI